MILLEYSVAYCPMTILLMIERPDLSYAPQSHLQRQFGKVCLSFVYYKIFRWYNESRGAWDSINHTKLANELSDTFPGQIFSRPGSMYRGVPPNGRLMPIRNPFLHPSSEDVRASECFDQISLIEGPVFGVEIKDVVWKTLSPNASSTTSKLVKKFQDLMGKAILS